MENWTTVCSQEELSPNAGVCAKVAGLRRPELPEAASVMVVPRLKRAFLPRIVPGGVCLLRHLNPSHAFFPSFSSHPQYHHHSTK